MCNLSDLIEERAIANDRFDDSIAFEDFVNKQGFSMEELEELAGSVELE